MDGKFVSDEAYKNGQKKIKKVRLILLIVCPILLAIGIVCMATWWYGWHGKGAALLLMFGSIATFLGFFGLMLTIGLTIFAHQREIVAYNASAILPVAGDVAEKGVGFVDKNADKIGSAVGKVLGPTIREVRGKTTENEKNVVCPKCQYKNDLTDKFCGGCGAKLEHKKNCNNCGANLRVKDKFCSECGAKVE